MKNLNIKLKLLIAFAIPSIMIVLSVFLGDQAMKAVVRLETEAAQEKYGLDDIALCVHLTDIIRGHKALGYTGRRAQEFVVTEFDRNVAVICRNHVPVVDSLADVADLFFDFILVLHFDSSCLLFLVLL